MACDATVDSYSREDGALDVSTKYLQLMKDTVSEDSLYIRAKDTFKVIFKDLDMTTKEKAAIVSEYIVGLTTNLSSAAMQTAVAWAKEERDGAYTLTKVKAETQIALAQSKKTQVEICLVQEQTSYQKAKMLSEYAGSLRDNGPIATFNTDGTPKTLSNSGLKYHQTKQVEASTYQIQADAFRKSGVVTISVDTDNVVKGTMGNTAGYTHQQTINAERQRQAYEDSKINHLLNSTGVIIGQMLSAEIDPDTEVIGYMKSAMGKLLTPNHTTPEPFGATTTEG